MTPQISPTSPDNSSQSPILTQHDTQILNQLLSPSHAPPLINVIDLDLPSPPLSLLALEASILAPLNTECPSSSALQVAIDALSELITKHPDYASAYNNRAQARRLLLGDDLRGNDGVWTDLSTAITLISGAQRSNSKMARIQVSKHEASVLRKAYTQRAWLLWKLAKSYSVKKVQQTTPLPGEGFLKEDEDGVVAGSLSERNQLPAPLRRLSREIIEEMASRDFALGGRYGDEGARAMAVRTSPYAKLCGEIVKEAMKGEMRRDGCDAV